jgi:hypothetical protein
MDEQMNREQKKQNTFLTIVNPFDRSQSSTATLGKFGIIPALNNAIYLFFAIFLPKSPAPNQEPG